jgi:hypothetical protein
MKNYHIKWLIVLLILFAAIDLLAQSKTVRTKDLADKPFMFSKVSGNYEYRLSDLQKLFTHNISDKISFPLSETQVFTGEVIEKLNSGNGLTSMNIRSENFPGALFNITLYKAENNVKISGRIINPKSGDVLIITEENNRYFIKKELQRLFMAECPL